MPKFEVVSKFADAGLPLPSRATKDSAGYDFIVAEDIIIPTWTSNLLKMVNKVDKFPEEGLSLDEVAKITKEAGAKPTLVSTGMKCQLESGTYLELSVRSSTPLKHWLVLANGIGIIDADYYNNTSNEGEIFFQLINMSPFPIRLKKGDKIGQGIIKKYEIANDDAATGERLGGFGSTTK